MNFFSSYTEKTNRSLFKKNDIHTLSIEIVEQPQDKDRQVSVSNSNVVFDFDQYEGHYDTDTVDDDSQSAISSTEEETDNSGNVNVNNFIETALEIKKPLPVDGDMPFCYGSTEGLHTKANFLIQMQNLAAKHVLTNSSLLDIFGLLDTFSNGHIKLGLKRTRQGESVLDLQRYLPKDRRDCLVHVCENECSSFFGTRIQCKICDSWRYTECKRTNCPTPIECNPFNRDRSNYHGPSQRIAKNSYYYRSLIILIRELLEWNLQNNCMDLFDYSRNRSMKDSERSISDVLDGLQAKRFLREMKMIFQLYAGSHLRSDLIEVSLLLSDFYDGACLFKRKNLSVWPLIVEILNCLPTDRSKSGVGQHVIALHHLDPGSKAEKQLFTGLFIKELETLQKGLIVSLYHDNKTYNYFVQARVIIHRLDTRALEKMAMIQCAPAKAGCSLCNSLKGVSRKKNGHPFKRVVYFGYRRLLPNYHWLRVCGMSKHCCPEGYYYGSVESYNWKLLESQKQEILDEENKLNVGEKNARYYSLSSTLISSCEPNSGSNYFSGSKERIDDKIFGVFTKDAFLGHCEPAHCDMRSYLEFERRPQKYYDKAVKKIKKGVENTKAPGVKGHSVYRKLQASDNANAMCYDPFHSLKNFATDIIILLIGEDGCEKAAIEAMHLEKRFLRIIPNDNTSKYSWNIPWLLSTSDCENADAALNCILIPVGIKKEFSVKNALRIHGYLKGVELIQYLCAFMTFSLHFTSLTDQYKNLFAVCAMVCSNIQSPRFEDTDSIDSLFRGTVEMLSLFECMLPDTVQKFSHHELLDIVDSIKKFGPVRCWWTLSGERLMKSIKDCVPSGGVNPLRTIYEKFVGKEKASLRSYKRDKSKWNNLNEFCDNTTKLVGKAESVALSETDFNEIAHAVYVCMQISELDDSLENLADRSPFFLLYMTFRSEGGQPEDFYDWLKSTLQTGMRIFALRGPRIYTQVSGLLVELLQWNRITIYTKAFVSGILHHARGIEWADSYGEYDISKQWNNKEQYSSWCKFKEWSFRSDPMTYTSHYGQLNYFFRIDWNNDSVVQHLSMASVFTLKGPDDKHLLVHCRKAKGIQDDACRFIPLYVIESTRVAVCGFSKNKPILVQATKETKSLNEKRYEKDAQKIETLYLIDLHPQRCSVKCSFEESRIPEMPCVPK